LIVAALAASAAAFFFAPSKRPRVQETEGMNGGDAAAAYDLVSRWPLFLWVRHMVTTRLRRFELRGALVDVGCGPGHLAIVIGKKHPDLSVTGVDLSCAMIEAAGRNLRVNGPDNVRFVVGDAHRLPVGDGEVDFVLSTLSAHHWRNAPGALREIHRVLKTGGHFLLMDLRRNAPLAFFMLLLAGERFFAPRSLRGENGALCSLRASYTPREIASLFEQALFPRPRVTRGFGWMFARGRKCPVGRVDGPLTPRRASTRAGDPA
jgi:ubiquinone/menaquinone biosynthesis C-methylase UbiE